MERSRHNKLRLLILEPYFGGSHRSFIELLKGLFSSELITLPARKWKWRMRLSAPYFAEQLHRSGKKFDRILCSTFIDVATFRGMAPAWVRQVPLLTYFHENQFVYPTRTDNERDFHFALTNMTTALASDSTAFNSNYNLDSFIYGINGLMKKSYDMKLADPGGLIRARARILHPPIDFNSIDNTPTPERSGPPVILWNHRWEHDKDPETFFKAIAELDRKGHDFRLVILGESFKDIPPVFKEVEEKLSGRILHWGFLNSREDYAKWLRRSDIVVSTAGHEFYGISVIEAVRAGCRPLLPNRLSYPELFPEEYLYNDGKLDKKLEELVIAGDRLTNSEAIDLTERFSWKSLAPEYRAWIEKPMET